MPLPGRHRRCERCTLGRGYVSCTPRAWVLAGAPWRWVIGDSKPRFQSKDCATDRRIPLARPTQSPVTNGDDRVRALDGLPRPRGASHACLGVPTFETRIHNVEAQDQVRITVSIDIFDLRPTAP